MEVIRYLQRARRPFLMPVVCHGRKANHPLGPSGSNVFKAMKKSGWYTHTLQDNKKNQATVSICVKRARWKDRHGKSKRETWVYAYWGIAPKRVDWVKETTPMNMKSSRPLLCVVTSVLRPGTCLVCWALTSITVKRSSRR